MSIRLVTHVGLLVAAVSSSVAMAASVQVVNPAVRAMPPGAPASGAYVTLENHSEMPRFLVDVQSDAAKTVEIHISEMKGDTMRMHQVDEIEVPAQGQVALKPGGYHIMMIGLQQPLKAGDKVDFTLIMKNGERVSMTAPVKSPEDMSAYAKGGMSMNHGGMDHGEMDHGHQQHGDMKHDDMSDGEHHH